MVIFSFVIVFVSYPVRNWPGIGNRLPDAWKKKLDFVW
jgi:hypothetical protein